MLRAVCLPSLSDDKKVGYLNKIVESRELEPERVLGRVHEDLLRSAKMPEYAILDEGEAETTSGETTKGQQMKLLLKAGKLLVRTPPRRRWLRAEPCAPLSQRHPRACACSTRRTC